MGRESSIIHGFDGSDSASHNKLNFSIPQSLGTVGHLIFIELSGSIFFHFFNYGNPVSKKQY